MIYDYENDEMYEEECFYCGSDKCHTLDGNDHSVLVCDECEDKIKKGELWTTTPMRDFLANGLTDN